MNTPFLNRLIRASLITTLGLGALMSATAAHAGARQGYPACIFLYENAGRQNLSDERACIRWGGFGIKGAGGDEKKFRDKQLKKDLPHFAQPVQYVTVRNGWAAKIWYEKPEGGIASMIMDQSGPVDIRRGKLRGIWTYEKRDRVTGYPLCIYTSAHDRRAKKDNLCLRYGEYADLKQFGWDTVGKRADYISVKSGFRIELYKKPEWGGGKWEVTQGGRLPKDIRNQVRSLRIVKVN